MQLTDEPLQVTLHERDSTCDLSLQRPEGPDRGPVPLLHFEVYNVMDQRRDPPVAPTVRAWTPLAAGGVHLELFDRQHRIALGMTVRVDAGRLLLRLLMSEWAEHDADGFRPYNVRFCPGLLQVGEAGALLLPLSSGRLVSPAGKPALCDEFLIYGEQSRWELLPMLPIASVGEGDSALAALATVCPEDAGLRVWTDGKGRGGIDAGACLRQNWIDPVDRMDREVQLVPMPLAPDLLHATAAVMRRHAMEDHGLRPLRERAETSPALRYALQAPSVKMRFGVRNQGIGRAHALHPDYGAYLNAMTFAEAGELLGKLKAAGIERAHTISVGILPNGHDGCYPSHARFDQRSGGEAAFKALLDAGHALGYHMNIHDNYNEAYETSPEFDWRWCTRDLHGEPQRRGRWGGGQAYLQAMKVLPHPRVEGAFRHLQALGLSGAGYIDAIGNPLYRNYSPEHGGPRRQHAEGIERVLRAAYETYGAVGTECGFFYAARHCYSVCMPKHHRGARPVQAHWPVAQLGGELVPLYNLALSGLIVPEQAGTGWQTIAEALLMGLHPRVNGLCVRGKSGGTPFSEQWLRDFKQVYDVVLQQHGHLLQQPLLRWRRDGDGSERSSFEDGTDVAVNFAAGTLHVNGTALDL